MRGCHSLVVVLALVCLFVPALSHAGPDGLSSARSNHLSGLFGARMHPVAGVLGWQDDLSRAVIDSSFDLISVTCAECGDPCPLVERTVQVVLEANAPVSAFYGVSDLSSGNYTVTDVAFSTRAALAAGEQVTITITGDVVDCGAWFNVWFSVCSLTPTSPACGCPTYSILRHFAGGADDGRAPRGTLVRDGSTFYGLTSNGGDSDRGVVFTMAADGTGYTHLHEFAGGAGDGDQPYGTPVLDGSTLYGLTWGGGSPSMGTLFSIDTDGSNFTIIHDFAGGADGSNPYGSPILSGTTLFGMTAFGGGGGFGTLFKVETNGTGYTLLHEFAGGASDGSNPYGAPLVEGSTLYGMARYGGDTGNGVIFTIGTDGTGYTHLHEFAGGTDDGREPYGDLWLEGSTLHGHTNAGGGSSGGIVFSIETDGSDFKVLHRFVGGAGDGRIPIYDNPVIDGCSMYGMALSGGSGNGGVIYRQQ